MKKKVIILGASGFVGLNLQTYLIEKGIEVHCVSLREDNWKNILLETDAEAIIHLVGKAHDLKNVTNPHEYYYVNATLTEEVLDTIQNNDRIKDFIFLSSIKSVADNSEGIILEDIVPNPITHYGKSKLRAEQIIQKHPINKNKRFFILRPCMIHGPNNKGNLNLLYQFVIKGLPYPLMAFDNKRSLLSIDNLCEVIFQLLINNKIPSNIYNISDSIPLSTKQIIEIIQDVTNKKILKLKIPKSIIVGVGKIGDLIRFKINSETLHKMTDDFQVSNQKILSALKIEDLPTSSRDGLKKTIQSFQGKINTLKR